MFVFLSRLWYNYVMTLCPEKALNKEKRLRLQPGQSCGKLSAILQGLPSSDSCRTSSFLEEHDLKHGELELTDTELTYIWKKVKRCQKRNGGVCIFR